MKACKMANKRFYKAKILLFGEYSVINGSNALAIPTKLFSGSWGFEKGENENQEVLYNLHQYLCKQTFFKSLFQETLFKADIDQGLIFNSDIPIGYGVGSSGALCAAIFDQYFQKDHTLEVLDIKKNLGLIESFFHGSSSGFDPLVCYLDKKILTRKGQVETVICSTNKSPFHLFLLDTKTSRKTAPLVKLYLEKYHTERFFKNKVDEKLNTFNNQAIQYYIENDKALLFQSCHEISAFQQTYFQDMIPKHCYNIWKKGLASDLFKIKLCGAGGGGFLLGITMDWERTKSILSEFDLLKIK